MKKKDNLVISKTNKQIFQIAVTAVAEAFGVDEHDILVSRRRPENKARARQMTYWLMRRGTNLSSPEVGALFLQPKNHATILNGENVIEDVFSVGDIPDNPYYKSSMRAAELFNEARRSHIAARNGEFKKKFEEVIDG